MKKYEHGFLLLKNSNKNLCYITSHLPLMGTVLKNLVIHYGFLTLLLHKVIHTQIVDNMPINIENGNKKIFIVHIILILFKF